MTYFIDIANINEIRVANVLGVICGVTTNPSLTPANTAGHAEARIYAVFLGFSKSFGDRYPSLSCKPMLL
jgi:transaldolase